MSKTKFEFRDEQATRPSMTISEPATKVTPAQPRLMPIKPVVTARQQAQAKAARQAQPIRAAQPIATAVPRTKRKPVTRPSVREMVDKLVAEFRQAKTAVTLSFAAGLFIGLPILGWWLLPVQYSDAPMAAMAPQHKAAVVEMAADLAAYDTLSPRVAATTYLWNGIDVEACAIAAVETDPAQRVRLISLAYRVNGVGCHVGETTNN